MPITETLRKDHQLLRKRLEFLEAAMQVAPEAQFALREMCWSLAHLLDAHIKREERVLAPYYNRIGALIQHRASHDHADQRAVLRDVNALLLGGIKAPVSRVVPSLAQLIEELREHMAEEEQEVFPMVDRMARERLAGSPTGTRPVVKASMTVNHVLHLYPNALAIFQAFQIDCDADGLHCLDELYWRRGIEVEALLESLNRAVASQVLVN